MTETVLIGMHGTKIRKGVACVLRGFERRGSEILSWVLAPGPPPLFSFNGFPEMTMPNLGWPIRNSKPV